MDLIMTFAVKPAIVLAVASLLALLLRRSSASLRHAVWFAAIVGAAALPVAGLRLLGLPRAQEAIAPLPQWQARQAKAL